MKKYIKKIIAIFTVMTLVGSNIPCSFAKESSTQELSAKEKYEQYLSETSGNTSDTQIIVKVKEDLAGGDNEAGVFTAAAMERSQRQCSIVKTIDSANISILETDANNLDSVLNELNSYEDIAYAQPDYKVVTAENGVNKNLWAIQNFGQTVDRSTGQSGFDTNLTRAWEITKGAEEVVVAVIDTGIDIHHESLQGSIWTNSGEIAGNNNDDDLNGYVNDINGWDFVNDDNTVYDMDALDEHGTHMAGIIAGSGEISGAAPNVKIMPLKALNYASGYTSDILEAIEYAKNNGAKIINCSFASIEYNPALEDAIASNPDILFVCAAGNYGCSTNEIATFPACYDLDNIIAVSAANNRGELSAFSTYGDDIDVAAPGVGIYSTLPAGRYGYKDGTSCSAAYISGIAALILSNDKELSAEQLKEKIISSMSSALPVENSDEAVQAEGFVDALAAINYPLEKKADAFAYTTDTEEYNLFEKYPFEISLMQNYPQIVFDASEGFDRVELKIYEETDEKIEEFIVDEDISTASPFLLSALLPDTDYRFSIKITKGITKYEYIGTLKYNSTENNQTLNSHVESAQQYEVPDNIPVSETIYYTAEEKENTIQTMSAGIINERENNNTIDLADLTFDDYDTYGYINPSSDIDYFKVKFNEKGVANFWLGNIPSGCDYELDLYDETGFRLASSHNSGDVQELIQFYPVDPNIYYYIKVSSYRGSSSTSPYLVRAKYYPLPDDYEKNDVPEDASALSKYKNTIYANINHPEDVDYYKISIPSKFLLTLDLVRPSSEYRFEIYKDPALTQSIIYTTGTTYTRELSSGTYYIKIYRITGYSGENYTLNMECNPIYTMEPGQAYFDKVKDSNNVYYQMEVSGNIGIQIDLSDYENADFDLFLYDANYVELAQSKTTNVAEQICESLTSGSYRIRVRRYSGTYENYLIETSVSTDENAAYLTSAAFPSSMNVNEVKTVKVLATNNGANAWQSSAGYKLGRLNDSASLTPNDLTLNSTERIPYKKSKTFIFNITAPEVDVSTSYTTGWRMKRNSLFFGDTLRKSITVEPNYDTLSVGTLKSVAGKPSGIKYAFTATSAGNYVFRTFKNITSCDTKLTIYDASMKRVAWNDDLYSGNLYSRLEVNLRAGIYYIEVTEFDEKPIYCHLSVEKYSFSDIQLNETEYIRNQYEGYYTFTVAQPGTYIITTEFYWEYCDTYLVLYNSEGTAEANKIGENDDNVSNYSRIAAELEAGTYYIRAATYDYQKLGINKLVNCKLFVMQESSQAGDRTASITISAPHSGEVVRTYEGSSIKISGSTANVRGVTVKVNGETIPGVKISGNKFECYYSPDESGSYTITATGNAAYGGENPTASINVTVVVNDDGDDFESATAVKEGTERIAAIDYAGDIDCFMFSPRRDGMYSVHTLGETDTVIEVFNALYTPVGYNDDDDTGRYGLNADVALYMAANQVYYIMVHHAAQAETGNYSLCINTLTDDNTNQKALTLNTPMAGKIDYPEDEDVFSFTPAESRIYILKTTGTSDTMGVVYDNAGNFMEFNDDGEDVNCLISVPLEAGSTYYFAVKHNRSYMYDQRYAVTVE